MGEDKHPLLTLQSVSGSAGSDNGGKGQGHKRVERETPQLQQPQQETPAKETKPTTRTMNHQPKPATKDRRSLSTLSHNPGRFAAMLVKAVAVATLVVLWLALMHTALSNSAAEEGSAQLASGILSRLSAVESGVASFARESSRRIASLLQNAGKAPILSIEHLQERIETGRTLLREYDDAAGASRACEGAVRAMVNGRGLHQDAKELLSLASSAPITSATERDLLAEALVCLGEARLTLSSSLVAEAAKGTYLEEARERFEAASAVDPTNPLARSGLGLSYLVLVLEHSNGANSLQLIHQSIQHLKAAVGLTRTAESEELTAVHAAARHNLGLAYLTLDGMSSSETGTAEGAKATHFLDWVASLQSTDASPSLTDSWALLANQGAALLHNGNVEGAISTLERVAAELCLDPSPSLRRKEVCFTARHNLDVAKNILAGGQPTTVLHGERSSIRNEVARWNAGALSELSAAKVSDSEPRMDSNATSALEAHNSTLTEASDEANKTLSVAEDTGDRKDTTSAVPVDAENIDQPIQKDAAAGLPSAPWGVKNAHPEMQNALAALEKATAEGPQRTRLLLALARARSSAGDASGAVDAALKAIGAATSDDETESATAYLETLMEKMAEERPPGQATKEDRSFEKPATASAFVEQKDFALTELQLKLELEKLRYKVLEQEMMLGRRSQNSLSYADEHRAIEYRQQEVVVQDVPRQRESESVVENVASRKTTKPIERDRTVDAMHQEEAIPVDMQQHEPEDAPSKNETLPPGDDEAAENVERADGKSGDTKPTSEDVAADQPDANRTTPTESESILNATKAEEEAPPVEPIELPSLFEPTLESPKPVPPTANSYMKMADAYLDKGQYALASKQFLKVIKKAPDHLHAHLGYATALERAGKSKQRNTAALAYGNATKVALMQAEEKVDPMAKAGAGGIAENILRRAVQICKSAPSGRLETLRQLSTYAHTAALAADIHFEVGLEIVKQGIEQEDKRADAAQAFEVANEFVASRNDTEAPYHIGSIVELGKIALEHESDAKRVIGLFGKVKNVHMEDNLHVELLVLVGRAHVSLGDLETAITEYTRAISFPESSSTPSAHHELAIALKKNNGDEHEINLHFEKALDLGMDPTPEAVEALGERNMALMRALNRQYYKSFESANAGASGGGIMSGGGVGSESTSVFAPRADQNEGASAQSETLTLLEQGAASYDGHNPMGGEVEGTESSLSNLNAKKQRGSESHLSDIQR